VHSGLCSGMLRSNDGSLAVIKLLTECYVNWGEVLSLSLFCLVTSVSVSLDGEYFYFNQMNDCQFLEKNIAPWSVYQSEQT
jgi:hypothetical protein